MSIAELVENVLRGLAVDGPPPPPAIPTCCRCAALATAAEKRGDPVAPLQPCESWVSPSGVKYFSGACRDCADVEWSIRWDRAWVNALGNETRKTALLEQAKAREAAGRRYLGTKRPGTVAAPHTSSCQCASCRTARADEEQARSLFPAGYASGAP